MYKVLGSIPASRNKEGCTSQILCFYVSTARGGPNSPLRPCHTGFSALLPVLQSRHPSFQTMTRLCCCSFLSAVPTEATFHALEEGVVEYCTAEPPQPLPTEAPVEMITQHADASVKPQALKSRIALNSAKLIQEQRVTNLHIKEIAQHLEQQNDLLQMIRRSQEVQACAQERQAQAMEGTQAALSVLIQVLRPMIKDFRRYLQSNTPTPAPAPDPGQVAQNGQPDSILQ